MLPSAISFDYWDTLYRGAALPERVRLRQDALRRMLDALGCSLSDDEFLTLYKASGAEAERWWREEHRGYTAAERIRWILERLEIERPAECQYVARAVEAVDNALLRHPPPLFDGVAEALRRLQRSFTLAITSDTGFASSAAQDKLLDQNGLRALFASCIYSMDVGHAKPRPEPFQATIAALALPPEQILHVGDNERTDIRGALNAGMRAVRIDLLKAGGPSAGEFVARSFDELCEYLSDDRETTLAR